MSDVRPQRIPESADIAVVTVIREERDAVRRTFGLKEVIDKDGTTYYVGWVPSADNTSHHFVICGKCLNRGAGSAQQLANHIIDHWKPSRLLIVGIGGGVADVDDPSEDAIAGIGRDDVDVGDVITSENLKCYDMVKEEGGEIKDRGMPFEPPSAALRKLVDRVEELSWWDALNVERPDQSATAPKIVPGEVLAGPTLFSDPLSPKLKDLLAKYDKALAVEMESGGVATAIYEKRSIHPVEFLTIRGVSDYCNTVNSHQVRQTWKKYAASTAAALALALVSNMPKRSRDQAAHDQYAEAFGRALEVEYPQPKVQFGLTVTAARDKTSPAESLAQSTKGTKRVILRGPAGGGKSMVLGRVARSIAAQDVIPIILKLKDWGKDDSKNLTKLESDDFNRRLDLLLRVSIVDLNYAMLADFPKNKLMMVDGLNEVSGEEIARQIVAVLDEYVRRTAPHATALVTDRLIQRPFLGHTWQVAELDPLDPDEVRQHIEQFGIGAYDSLPETDRRLLEIPYFLEYALERESPHLGSAAKAIESFFSRQMKFEEDMDALEALAEASFKAYKNDKSLSFNAQAFQQHMSSNTWWQRLLAAGVLKESVEGQAEFDHQLKHDYLASRYLARHQESWNWTSFDALSFESSSFEALSMTLEQLPDAGSGDKFLKRVYDWNWSAAVTCMAEAVRTAGKHYNQELEVAVLALVAEKLFDPVHGTRERAKKVLSTFPAETAKEFRTADSPQGLLAMVREIPSDDGGFLEWKELFSRPNDPPLCEEEIQTITSNDSILGWTASNLIRRFGLKEADFRQVRAIYNSFDRETELDGTVRWRAIHALGAFPARENVRLLFGALDHDKYKWAKYGAARSLVEMAAKTTDDRLRSQAIEGLTERIVSLKPNVVEEIGRAAFYEGAPKSWASRVIPLLQRAVEIQKSEADRERWEKLVIDFKRRPSGATKV